MPDLRQLRAFVAVAEELNFTRAAERLYSSQQAVSKTVSQLERQLGVTLLARTTHEVQLTAAGAVLLTEGRAALAAADEAFQHTREIGHRQVGTITVGVTPAIGPTEREQIIEILRAGPERVSVSLLDVRGEEIARSLRSQRADVVVARSNRAKGLQVVPLRPTPAIVCLPITHPLASAPSVRLVQLDGSRLLTWSPRNTPYTEMLISRFAAAGCTVTPVQAQVTGVSTLTELHELGAVALMPAPWPPSKGIAQLPIEDNVSLPLYLLTTTEPAAVVQRIRSRMAAA